MIPMPALTRMISMTALTRARCRIWMQPRSGVPVAVAQLAVATTNFLLYSSNTVHYRF